MARYLLKRLLLIVPTLFGVMLINFVIVQAAPGGPIEQIAARLSGVAGEGGHSAISGPGHDGHVAPAHMATSASASGSVYSGASGVPPDVLKDLEKQFGFDKPAHERFFLMMKNYLTFDFGESYLKNRSVIGLILDKMPVSISLGLWSTLLIYGLSIPLGIRKAVRDGSRFDVATSMAISVGYAVPSFLLAVFLVILFAGGEFFSIFPLRGLSSEGWNAMPLWQKITDYLWHVTLPVISLTVGGFAALTMLTKNCFIEEIHKQYIVTARAKGASERRALYGHAFRNAMLIVIAGFPSAFISMFFAGSLVVETIFSLDGMGLLGFEATLNRDYPVMFGTLYIFSLIGLVMNVIGDVAYVLIDPRINFDASR
ncbi:MAG: microcin C ABC transporter permease YejB [Rickettsiales bacterium]